MPSSRSACSAVPHSADAGGARNSRSGPGPARADQTQPGALCLRAGGGLPATNRVHPRGEVPQLAGHGEYGGAGTGPRPRRAAARESLSPPRPRPPPGQQTVAALGRPPEGRFYFLILFDHELGGCTSSAQLVVVVVWRASRRRWPCATSWVRCTIPRAGWARGTCASCRRRAHPVRASWVWPRRASRPPPSACSPE